MSIFHAIATCETSLTLYQNTACCHHKANDRLIMSHWFAQKTLGLVAISLSKYLVAKNACVIKQFFKVMLDLIKRMQMPASDVKVINNHLYHLLELRSHKEEASATFKNFQGWYLLLNDETNMPYKKNAVEIFQAYKFSYKWWQSWHMVQMTFLYAFLYIQTVSNTVDWGLRCCWALNPAPSPAPPDPNIPHEFHVGLTWGCRYNVLTSVITSIRIMS